MGPDGPAHLITTTPTTAAPTTRTRVEKRCVSKVLAVGRIACVSMPAFRAAFPRCAAQSLRFKLRFKAAFETLAFRVSRPGLLRLIK